MRNSENGVMVGRRLREESQSPDFVFKDSVRPLL